MSLIELVGGVDKAKEILDHDDAKDAEYYILEYGYVSWLGCCGASDSSFVNATKHEDGGIYPITFNGYFNTVESVVNFESTIDLGKLDSELFELENEVENESTAKN